MAAIFLEDKTGETVTIENLAAYVIYVDPWTDVAVFQSAAHEPALTLADAAPEACHPFVENHCETFTIIGYPYGITRTVTQGTLGARNVPILHPTYERYVTSDILDLAVAGGNSGSPVLNAKGEVVGVLWGGFVESPHSLSVPWDSVKRALGGYWR
jgi:S1-C subfamily serine protease